MEYTKEDLEWIRKHSGVKLSLCKTALRCSPSKDEALMLLRHGISSMDLLEMIQDLKDQVASLEARLSRAETVGSTPTQSSPGS